MVKQAKPENPVKLTKHPDKNPSHAELEKWLRAESMSPFVATMGPGDYAPAHAHDYDEARVIVSGKIEFEIAGKKYVLGAGERMDLAAGTEHDARTVGSENVVMLCASKPAKESRNK